MHGAEWPAANGGDRRGGGGPDIRHEMWRGRRSSLQELLALSGG